MPGGLAGEDDTPIPPGHAVTQPLSLAPWAGPGSLQADGNPFLVLVLSLVVAHATLQNLEKSQHRCSHSLVDQLESEAQIRSDLTDGLD